MIDKQTVVASILSRPESAAELLTRLLDMAEGGLLDLEEYRVETPQRRISGDPLAPLVRTGPTTLTVTLTLIGEAPHGQIRNVFKPRRG